MNVLITGGTGYIGSHTAVSLLESGYGVIIADNLSNSNILAVNAIKRITGKDVTFYHADLSDYLATEKIFRENSVDAVIHFAGLKSNVESVMFPLRYYKNNVGSTMSLLSAMKKYGVNRLVFSSSATVYKGNAIPYKEDMPISNFDNTPYGCGKAMVEKMLTDCAAATPKLQIVALRYFNPVGAHESGLLNENPKNPSKNLMPGLIKVAAGEEPHLNIYGNDYNTHDGTCVRDFIHVCDLAEGHIKALEHLKNGMDFINLGTGKGYSILEVHRAFEKVNNIKIPYVFAPRRKNTLPIFYADTSKAKHLLDWEATRTLNEMVKLRSAELANA
ncbi:MAG: UDP-glucose 4-epimerase GalE [Ruminococcus sp.]|jgi:UDP-glucose 4-epimerase|nr:UDP-glucose 4-epimerase GalE [Ruminococcus sp.]